MCIYISCACCSSFSQLISSCTFTRLQKYFFLDIILIFERLIFILDDFLSSVSVIIICMILEKTWNIPQTVPFKFHYKIKFLKEFFMTLLMIKWVIILVKISEITCTRGSKNARKRLKIDVVVDYHDDDDDDQQRECCKCVKMKSRQSLRICMK